MSKYYMIPRGLRSVPEGKVYLTYQDTELDPVGCFKDESDSIRLVQYWCGPGEGFTLEINDEGVGKDE